MKKLPKIFFSIFLICFSCQNSPMKRTKQTLRLNIQCDPPTLDPRKSIDLTSQMIIKMLFEGLMRKTPDGNVVPALAESMELSQDKKTYVFSLRKAQWTDGYPITAYDFERTYKQILEPTYPSPYAYKLYPIKNAKQAKEGKISLENVGIKAHDEKTLIIHLEQPVPYFLELLTQAIYFPMHEKSHKITSGPFKLQKWKHNLELSLQKNPFYWDEKNVQLERVFISICDNPEAVLSLFECGELDWAGNPFSPISPDAYPTLKSKKLLEQVPIAATTWIDFNVERFPFYNKNIRRAFAYAISRKILIENILHTPLEIATSAIPPQLVDAPQNFFDDGDKVLAQSFLHKGLKELEITIEDLQGLTLTYNKSDENHSIAQVLQAQWLRTLGIFVNLENQDWTSYLHKLKSRKYHMARMLWIPDFSDPMAFLELFKYKDSTANYPGWEHPTYSNILDRACLETDPSQRSYYMQIAEEFLMSHMPIAPIYFHSYHFVKARDLKNVYLSLLGEIDLKYAYFEDKQ